MKKSHGSALLLLFGFASIFPACQFFPNSMKSEGNSPAISSMSHSQISNALGDKPAGTGKLSESLAPGKVGLKIVDSQTLKQVNHAVVFHDGRVWGGDSAGRFEISAYNSKEPIFIKAAGYERCSILKMEGSESTIRLLPFHAKGLYLTYYGVSSKMVRDGVLSIIQEGKLNALVIDVKGDRGYLSFKMPVPLAQEIGANRNPTLKDVRSLIADLHARNIYVIGRIVVFKDNLLSSAHPEWAVINAQTGKPWKDSEQLGWVDPFRKQVWDYNLALAAEAARAGFDEIQFDYVRFPAGGKNSTARFSQPNTMENRVKTVRTFLEAAREKLLPSNVYLAADIFGYVPWNLDDTNIGQKISEVAGALDYLCLMLYPSGFHLGIPGYRNPVKNPREVVYLTLERAKKLLPGETEKLRPWLQNFKDYAFDRRVFAEQEIQSQIKASQDAGTSGWLLWDPSNRYQHTLKALTHLQQFPETATKMAQLP